MEAFKTLASQVSDISDDFAEAAGQFILQMAAGRDYFLIWKYDVPFFTKPPVKPPEYGEMYLNLPYIIMGKSRTGRKTWVTDKITEAAEQLSPDALMANSFSPEALIDDLAEKYNPASNSSIGILIIDDCGGFFDSLKKEYMASLLPTVSSILSNRDFKRRTRAMKGESAWVRNPYLIIWMNGTRDLPKKFERGWFEQGYANRQIYVFGKRKVKQSPGLDEKGKLIQTQLLAYLEQIHNPPRVNIIDFDTETRKYRKVVTDGLEERLDKEEFGDKESWISITPLFIDKVAAIKRLSHVNDEEREAIKNGRLPRLLIGMEDYKYAEVWIKKCEGWLDQVIEKMTEPRSEKDTTQKDRIERIFNIIRAAGAGGIQKQKLYRKADLDDSRKLKAVVDVLLQGERISEEKVPTKGATATVYKALN